MATETSNGKARTTMPRSSDLKHAGTERNRGRGRDEKGRAAAGNDLATGRRWKRSLKKLAGPELGDASALAVAEDGRRLFAELVRELPSDGASVRQLVALQARHGALAAFFGERAAALGFETAAGIAAEERATRHGQRAERLAVTALDIATRLAGARRAQPIDLGEALAAGEEPLR